MALKRFKILALLLTTTCFTSCNIFLKPKLEKFYGYESGKQYNTHKFYSAPFEIQIGDDVESMMHIYLSYEDSTYRISIINNDSIDPMHRVLTGKYRISEKGKVQLTGNSPFENNVFQIVVTRNRGSLFAEFKLNSIYGEIFTHKKRRAYCEVNYPWDIRDCRIEESYP